MSDNDIQEDFNEEIPIARSVAHIIKFMSDINNTYGSIFQFERKKERKSI